MPVEPSPTPETAPAPVPTGPPHPKTRAWCLFESLGGSYAVDLETVLEVLEVDELVRLPLRPPSIFGLCLLRRDVVPVVNVASGIELRDGLASAVAEGPQTVLVLAGEAGAPIGVPIRRESTIVTGEPPDDWGLALSEAPDALAPGADGWVRRGDATYTVIDPVRAWHDLRSSVKRWHGLGTGVG